MPTKVGIEPEAHVAALEAPVAAWTRTETKSRIAENISFIYISKNALLMFPTLSRLTMLRSEPTDKWNASAMARPLTLGEVSMTRRIHSSDKRPLMVLENVCAAGWEVSC